jgi:threonine 3-dehydrogenase
MKAIIKRKGSYGAEFEKNIPIPEPSPEEVLVKIKAAAICGTDLHIYQWNEWAKNVGIKLPLIMGHEFSGEVIGVGNRVEEIKIGDYIAGETHISCGKCFQCKNGLPHICKHLTIFGIHTPGCFAEYTTITEKCARKISPTISQEIGAILEPLGTGLRASMELELSGDTVAIVGCGPIGLFALASAKAMGASKIIALDVIEERLRLAKKMGANFVLNSRIEADIIAEITSITHGIGVDAFIDASGNVKAINLGFKYLRKGGKVALIGLPSKKLEINLGPDIVFKEAKIVGIHGRELFKTWTKMENMLENGVLNVDPVITHKLPLEQYKEGFELLEKGRGSKILLIP